MEATAFSLHYATTPRKNDEGSRFRQTFAYFRHQFRQAKGLGDFRPTHWIGQIALGNPGSGLDSELQTAVFAQLAPRNAAAA